MQVKELFYYRASRRLPSEAIKKEGARLSLLSYWRPVKVKTPGITEARLAKLALEAYVDDMIEIRRCRRMSQAQWPM